MVKSLSLNSWYQQPKVSVSTFDTNSQKSQSQSQPWDWVCQVSVSVSMWKKWSVKKMVSHTPGWSAWIWYNLDRMILRMHAGHQVENILAHNLYLPSTRSKYKGMCGDGSHYSNSITQCTQGIRENLNLKFHINVNNMKLVKQALHFGLAGSLCL